VTQVTLAARSTIRSRSTALRENGLGEKGKPSENSDAGGRAQIVPDASTVHSFAAIRRCKSFGILQPGCNTDSPAKHAKLY
jgi:hypothetical protein